jgi:hypothetical protein
MTALLCCYSIADHKSALYNFMLLLLCCPAGQTSPIPFDNNVFKVACDGIRGISKGSSCDWNDKCTDPTKNETAQGCPFDGRAREAFQRCSAMPGYPKPGLRSDRFFCQDPPTQGRMVSCYVVLLCYVHH